MRTFIILLGSAAGLAACGQSSPNQSAINAAPANAAAEAPKPAYCFFKDSETKDWKGTVDPTGNVVVSGEAYREDSRYKAVLSPATVNGTTATVAPTIAPNETGYAAPGNWWAVTETIPNSQRVDTVDVKCGDGTLATIKLARNK